MYLINSRTVVVFLNLPKSSGLEKIDQRQVNGKLKNKSAPTEFGALRDRLAGDKYCIIRFGSSSRMIGKMIDQTFYPFWIHLKHSLYQG